jgi:hypothetical protein
MRHNGWGNKARMMVFLVLFSWIANVFALDIVNSIQTYSSLTNTIVNMSGVSELHITSATAPISGCTINLNSVDSFFFLEQILPSVVSSTYLSQIRVNGAAAVLNTNCRIVEYVSGAVVIPHASSFQPLLVYAGYYYTGTSQSISQYTYYKTSQLGTLNNNISSFKLKRGYMATFAQNENGTGLSRNYIAQDADINIAVIPEEMDNSISFICVFPWRWVSKKGSCDIDPTLLNAKWNYNWNISSNSTLDWEYVAIKQQPWWPSLSQDWQWRGVNHVLGLNEPDNPVQDAYKNLNPPGSTASAIWYWPDLLGTGLRAGAPAVTDGGLSWLYDFMDQADALNYRVDFVPIHYYRDNESISTIRNWLAGVYQRTGRPIWLTEWNDGCNWTGGDPTDPYQHAARIDEIITALDDMPFVERYAIYNGCSYRELITNSTLTPAGVVYLEHEAPAAYAQVHGKGAFASAYYRFDNNAKDSLFYENHGSAQRGATYTTGRSGQAIDLDGTNDYVNLPENLTSCADFTFAAWIYWDGGNQWQRIFDFGHGNLRYMCLTPRSGGNTLRFVITTTSNTNEQTMETAQMASAQWVHVAVTLSGNIGRLFVNGSQVATNTNITLNPSDLRATSHYLGRSHWVADPYFNGRLDEVHVAGYALSNAQITALYNGTAGNIAPAFRSNPVTKPNATQGSAYSKTLVYDASDFDAGGMLTFSKVSGPTWLTVAADGTLSGTPGSADVGQNTFVVRVADSLGASNDATLNIQVNGLGLQSLYSFEANTDDSIGPYDGTAAGSAVYAAGKIGQAITFDGVDDVVTLPAGVINTADVTIAAWVYWNGGSLWQRIFDFGNDTTQYIFLAPNTASSTLRFTIKNGGAEQYVQTSQLATAAWVHVAASLSSNTGKLYVNGVLAATNTAMTINPTDFNPVINYIGDSQYSADPFFNGRIDDFRIYNCALSDAQVAAIVAGNTAPTFTSDPINNLSAIEFKSYSGQSLVAYANDVDGLSTLTFSKDAGPDWLVVASGGSLSGVPADADVGTNAFTVRVTDNGGLSDTAQMTIQVANTYSGIRGLEDMAGFAENWLMQGCSDTPACSGADLDGDQDVDLADFSMLANYWMIDETLQLHLKLDETSGTAAGDGSVYARPGTLTNGPVWSTGRTGGALTFDGANDYVEISGYKGVAGTTSRTCSAWIKTSGSTSNMVIMDWGTAVSGQKWLFGIFTTGQLALYTWTPYIQTNISITDNQWHHVAAVLTNDGTPDVNEIKLYVDGLLQATTVSSAQAINTIWAANVLLGACDNAGAKGFYFNGLMDEVRIYNRALNEQEIASIAQ